MNQTIKNQLCAWYEQHGRPLPWRDSGDPYLIWLSEIILQQTRVVQGLPYFLKFKTNFPTVKTLAAADEDSVLKLWQGLGYYSRARNLHSAAKQVVNEFDGVFPETYADLLKLKGVGPYTAAAIASIAFGLPEAVVDGNVIRVISRLFGISDPVDEGSTLKSIKTKATALLDRTNPGRHNQAMMDFGSTVCTPKLPLCDRCPISKHCVAFGTGKTTELPLKTKKTKKAVAISTISSLKMDKTSSSKKDTNWIFGQVYISFLCLKRKMKPSLMLQELPKF